MTPETARINIVGKYVDALDVSIFGKPQLSVFEGLRDDKKALRVSRRGLREFGPISGVPGGPLVLTTEGSASYHFVLQNAAIKRLVLTDRGTRPKAFIQFRAGTLHEHDLEEVDAIVGRLASFFLEEGFGIKVSRFDFAVDSQLEGWEMPEVEDIICRAGWKVHGKAEYPTGITFGSSKGPLQVVLYNKSEQIRGSHAEWMMREVWTGSGRYDERLPVIRIELRFFRTVLRQFKRQDPLTGQLRGIDTVLDLNSSIGDLVRYVVGGDGKRSWFRVASPDTRARKTERREAAQWWREITHAFLGGTYETGRARHRSISSSPDYKRNRRLLITSAVQTAAWERVCGYHTATSPEEYLGPVSSQYLHGWLKAKNLRSFEEAVDFEVKRLISSGKVP